MVEEGQPDCLGLSEGEERQVFGVAAMGTSSTRRVLACVLSGIMIFEEAALKT